MCVCVCVFVCLFVCLFDCLFVCLFVYLCMDDLPEQVFIADYRCSEEYL